MPKDFSENWNKVIQTTIKTGKTTKGELVFYRSKGNHVFQYVIVPEFSDRGNVQTALALLKDITKAKRVEEQLLFQSTLFSTTGESLIGTDVEGKIIYWNDAARRIYGWTSEEVIGRNIGEVNVPQISQQQAIEIMEKLRRGETWSGEFTVQRRDGEVFPAIVTDSPVIDSKGKLVGIIGVSVDISERKKIEEDFRKQASLIDLSPDAIIVKKVDDTITFWSKGAQNVYGWTKDEAIGKRVFCF